MKKKKKKKKKESEQNDFEILKRLLINFINKSRFPY